MDGVCGEGTWRGYAEGYVEGVHGGGMQKGMQRGYTEGVCRGVHRGGMQRGM